MIKGLLLTVILTSSGVVHAQTATPRPSPSQTVSAPSQPAFDLKDFGVRVEPDSRLVIVMAALDAAGFDPTPAGKEPGTFRMLVRKDQASLDSGLRERLHGFFESHKLPAPATAAEQAARYVSLAYALGPAPALEAPDQSIELPGGVLEVLDFAPLLREFYKKSGIDERLPSYMSAYQAEGQRMRQPTANLLRALLTYLHTQPITVSTERISVKSPDKKKNPKTGYTTVEHERRFFIVPDLLAAPAAINFRIIADDYFVIVPEGTDPTASELRRAYIQYVIDALVMRHNKSIAERREQVKQLIDARARENATISPDAFVVVTKSLVAAADARFEESVRLAQVDALQRLRLSRAKDDATRTSIAREAQSARAAIADETIARLAEDYEGGAALDFYFADQLRDISNSGFDLANFFADMIAGFDPAREGKRLSDAAASRARAVAARKAHPRYSLWLVDPSAENRESADTTKSAALTRNLKEVETLLQTKNYSGAETRLKELLQDYPGEARLFFALGQTASLWARDTTDDDLQEQRLNQALAHYGFAVQSASPDADRALLSRAHEAMGRILAFLDRKEEAMKEFDSAIKLGEVAGGAYSDAIAGKRKLAQP